MTKPTYSMRGDAVVIHTFKFFSHSRFHADPEYSRKSIEQAIKQVKGQRDWYSTQEAYDADLTEVEGALAYLDAHAPASAIGGEMTTTEEE